MTLPISVVCRWASSVNIRDFPRSGRSHTAQTLENVQCINSLILADKRVTVQELSLQMGAGESSISRIIETVAV